jgi:Fe2+ or Zn2+ uptake regulation protein
MPPPAQSVTAVSALPTWIDDRIDRNLDNALTQEHVVETMLASERPFFSIRQLQARVKPDVSKATVRNRLQELQELDVVATETYPESVTLYYVNHPESAWPLSPEGKRALSAESPLDRLSTRGFLTMQDTVGIRTLVLAGFQLTLVMLALGAVLAVAGVDLRTTADIGLWASAVDLLAVSVLLLVVERTARWLRTRFGPLDVFPRP